MNEVIDRLVNVHTLKAVGAALVGWGLLTSENVDAAIAGGGGNVYVTAAGIALYVVYGLLRKA